MDPFVYAAHKHHMPAMVELLDRIALAGSDCEPLLGPLLALGEGVCDVYVGVLAVAAVQAEILGYLATHGIGDRSGFDAHLRSQGRLQRLGHYLEHPMPDGSRFVIRLGDDPARYIHLHPSRHAPLTRRARMSLLKSALLGCALAASEGGEPRDLARLNRARSRVDLPPLASVPSALGELIDQLWSRRTGSGPAR